MKIFPALAALALSVAPAAQAGEAFLYEVDRFDGIKTASFDTTAKCVQTKGIKGKANLCLVINIWALMNMAGP